MGIEGDEWGWELSCILACDVVLCLFVCLLEGAAGGRGEYVIRRGKYVVRRRGFLRMSKRRGVELDVDDYC